MFNGIKTDGKFEVGGGQPIPDNTTALAYIKDVGWKEYEGESYINIQWQLLKPEEFKNKSVFQKVKLNDSDKIKAERALKMLAAIDHNAGGKLAKINGDPTDMDLMSALGKAVMVIKIKTWEMNGNTGNWICAVSSKKATTQVELPASEPEPDPVVEDDDNIPF